MGRHFTGPTNESSSQRRSFLYLEPTIGAGKTAVSGYLRTVRITGARRSPSYPSTERSPAPGTGGTTCMGSHHGCSPSLNAGNLPEMSQRYPCRSSEWKPHKEMKTLESHMTRNVHVWNGGGTGEKGY